MKRFLSLSLIFLFFLSGCSSPNPAAESNEGSLKIMTTLFPNYDFARAIVQEKGEVSLLLPPGAESHSFEPTPSDIIKINQADIFIYTGKEMEHWVSNILQSLTNPNLKIIDLSQNIPLSSTALEEDEEEHHEEDGHNHTFDPHIWTSPIHAQTMTKTILASVIEADSQNAEFYQKNGEKYLEELEILNTDLRNIVDSAPSKTLYFGGRNAFHYLLKEYGLTGISAYDSCSLDGDPSPKVVADLIDILKTQDSPILFYEELVDPKVANSIHQEVGGELFLLHSTHNLTKEDIQSAQTYLSLMKTNIEHIKKALYPSSPSSN